MSREEFKRFVEETIENVLSLAEQKTGLKMGREPYLQWVGKTELITKNIAEVITGRVFLDPEHIYPCVDIGVGEVLADGRPVISASIAGYEPCSFTKNWTGRPGPFVYIVGSGLFANPPVKSTNDKGMFFYSVVMPEESTSERAKR